MRNTIGFLIFLMFLLLSNIIAYSVSEDYRFLLKKMKYQEDVVYDDTTKVDDIDSVVKVIDKSTDQVYNKNTIRTTQDGMTFLDALSGKKVVEKEEDILPELHSDEKHFLKMFAGLGLEEVTSQLSLFDLTTEYPDEYREYSSKNISIYMFSTKTYQQVKKIFTVLEYDLPYTLNEKNNFTEASFYINLEKAYDDGFIRLILKYKNKSFGLKIKKDNYNVVKRILNEL